MASPMASPMVTTPPTTEAPRFEAMLRGVVQVLSLRALLLLALVGAFVLAIRAMGEQTPMSLGVLTIYCTFAVIPVAFLEIRRHIDG